MCMKKNTLLNSFSRVTVISLLVLMSSTMTNSLNAQKFSHVWAGGTGAWETASNWYTVHASSTGVTASSGATSITLAGIVSGTVAANDYVAGFGITPGTTVSSVSGTFTCYFTANTAPTTAPTAGATYTSGGNTYTVVSYTTLTKVIVATCNVNAATSTGTLAKSTGTGDSNINYTTGSSNGPTSIVLSTGLYVAISSQSISFYKNFASSAPSGTAGTNSVQITSGTCTLNSNVTCNVQIGNTSATNLGKLIIASGYTLTASSAANTPTFSPVMMNGGIIENLGTLTTTVVNGSGYCIRFENPAVTPTLPWGYLNNATGTLNMFSNTAPPVGGGVILFNNSTTLLNQAPEIDLNNATYTISVGQAAANSYGIYAVAGASGIIGGAGLSIGTLGTPTLMGLLYVAGNNNNITVKSGTALSCYGSSSYSYNFTVPLATAATLGATYSDGTNTYTVLTTKASNTGTTLVVTCPTALSAAASLTLSKGSGTGDASITATAFAYTSSQGIYLVSSVAGSVGNTNNLTFTNNGSISVNGTYMTAYRCINNASSYGKIIINNNSGATLSSDITAVNSTLMTVKGALHFDTGISNTNVVELNNAGTMSIKQTSNGAGTGYALFTSNAANTPGITINNNSGGTISLNCGSQVVNIGGQNSARTTTTTINNAGTFTIDKNLQGVTFNNNNGGTLDCGSAALSGAYCSFAANAGSTLKTALSGGLGALTLPSDGAITCTATATANGTAINATFNAAANYVFNGASAQTTGALLTNANAITVDNSAGLSLSQNTTTGSLIINSGKALSVPAGKQLTVSSSMSNSGTLNLLSDNTGVNGTATIITPATITENSATYNVQQYVTSNGTTGLNARNWYISSPLSAASSSVITTATGNGLVYYDGTTNWPAAPSTMVEMKGYIAKAPAQNTTINFTGGTLNTGDKSVSNLPLGFNLVGNPYPSSLDFAQATKTNVANSIWYRSKKTGSYNFHTYNVTGGVSVNDGVAIIAPMQAFWIKTTSATNTLGFTNNMRSHQDQTVVANRLMVPKVNAQQMMRLQVSNSVNKDESVIYFNTGAQNTVDDYDSQKMFNNTAEVPEIFTVIEGTNLAINGMNTIPYDSKIPLGFKTITEGNFSISVPEFKNFEIGTKVILKDNQNPTVEIDLSTGEIYNFNAPITASTSDRFSLLFRAPSNSTGIETTEKTNAQVFVNAANQIMISSPEKSKYAIYNAMGQLIENGTLNSELQTVNCKLQTGIFVVKVNNESTRVIVK